MERWQGTQVRSIRIFEVQGADFEEVKAYKGKKKKKKTSKWAKRPEKNSRRFYAALRTYANEGEKQHEKANEKKNNGFLRRFPTIQRKALKKADKQMKKIRFY